MGYHIGIRETALYSPTVKITGIFLSMFFFVYTVHVMYFIYTWNHSICMCFLLLSLNDKLSSRIGKNAFEYIWSLKD